MSFIVEINIKIMIYLVYYKKNGDIFMDKNLDISQLEFNYLDLVACFTGNNSTNLLDRAKVGQIKRLFAVNFV